MAWHYQPVYTIRETSSGNPIKEYTICEVYLDADDKLELWTESHEINPFGESVEELLTDLEMMSNDCKRWMPVEFTALTPGMIFEEANESNE